MVKRQGFFEPVDSLTGKAPEHQRNALKCKNDISNAEVIQQDYNEPVFTKPVTFQVLMDNLPDSYMVGGAIRDEILGLKPHDIDIVTSATPDKVLAMFERSHDVGGQKYGTVIVLLSDEPREVEVTTMRKEMTGGRHPKVVFTKSILEDLSRRDFTFSAMAKDDKGNIIDPYDGIGAIQRKEVVSVYDPYQNLDEMTGDPLRAIRAVRFSHRFGFSIEPTLEDAIRKADLTSLSGERIYMELEKMFEVDAASAIEYLDYYDILEKILPEIKEMQKCQHNKIHHPEGDCFQHTLRTLEFVQDENMLTKMAALLHDIGKPIVRRVGSTKYHAHDKAGIYPGETIMRRLGRPKVERDTVVFVINNHMKMHKIHEMKPSKRRALYDSPFFPILLKVTMADGSMRDFIDPYEIQRYVESDEITRKTSAKPLIDGHAIMSYGIPPGPLISEIQKDIVEQQLNGNITTEEEARQYFEEKYVQN